MQNILSILEDSLDREKLVLSMIKLTKEKRIKQEGVIQGLNLAITLLKNEM